MKLISTVAILIALAIPLPSQCGGSRSKYMASSVAEDAIRAVLNAQVEAWNRHDLEGFMAGYWHSPDLTFFSGDTRTSGWDGALARYRQSYAAPGKEMGTLSFSDLQIELLAPDSAFVRGRYHLVMTGGKNPEGLFTLIWRKVPEGWRIIHDHSSSAAN